MRLGELEGKTLLVRTAQAHEILVEDVTNGYPGGDKYVIRGAGNEGGAYPEVSVARLAEQELK